MSIAEPTTTTPALSKPALDFQTISRSPAFVPGLVLLAGIALIYWTLWPQLYLLWIGEDGYYSHGWLVPIISGFIVYRAWPRINSIPVRAEWVALIPLAITIYLAWLSSANLIYTFMSMALVATLLFGSWLIAGWRWMLALAPASLYLAFALPLWTVLINNNTNPLQVLSTKGAYYFLKILGFGLVYDGVNEPTVIHMDHWDLNVAVACSGMKLLLALVAFTMFFILIARLPRGSMVVRVCAGLVFGLAVGFIAARSLAPIDASMWGLSASLVAVLIGWANTVMIALVLPLALMTNAIRIGLVGVVGELQNEDAGMVFHDYSGYITLILCFFILFKVARWLGWKD